MPIELAYFSEFLFRFSLSLYAVQVSLERRRTLSLGKVTEVLHTIYPLLVLTEFSFQVLVLFLEVLVLFSVSVTVSTKFTVSLFESAATLFNILGVTFELAS